MRIIMMTLAVAAVAGIAWPLISAMAGGGGNEATRLVEATERTQNKAGDVTSTYNDIIPPAPPNPESVTSTPAPGQGQGWPQATQAAPYGRTTPYTGAGNQYGNPAQPQANEAQDSAAMPSLGGAPPAGPSGIGSGNPNSGNTGPGGTQQPDATQERSPWMSQSEHAVMDAMQFLARVDAELGPSHSEYTMAVDRLKRAWQPRYDRAVEEYRRFAERVNHAEKMAYEYLEVQQKLTQTVSDTALKRTHEERDAREQILILDWINQANTVLGQAYAIKLKLDDMNVSITKLELSATFASVYEGFVQMPIAITLLNGELDRFHQESELIYQTFGPQQAD